jgi:ribonuclease Y
MPMLTTTFTVDELTTIFIVSLIFTTYISFLFGKRAVKANSSLFVKQAKAKAKSIEKEAEYFHKEAKIKAREYELQHRQSFDKKMFDLETEAKDKIKSLKRDSRELDREKSSINKLKSEYDGKLKELYRLIEKTAKMSRSEAQEVLMKRVEEQEEALLSKTVRQYEQRAKEDAERKANYLLAQATTRFAGDFAAERLVNTVKLNSDDIKGRIIGKEGRNIKRLEAILGVDIIVDGTPRTITLSSFNLYRRAIAVKTIERLIEDGRIQPARIEEIYEKVVKEFSKDTQTEGENVAIELGIGTLHPELVKLVGKLKYRASYGQNALAHSIEVAYIAGMISAELGGDEILARRAGLLHDIGKALTHDNGGNHVELGVEVCKKYGEGEEVINGIYAHHEYEEAKTIEVAAVCTADKLSAGRPGARREVLENSLKRIKKIEEIALSHGGVSSAYAVNSGRELRVIVNSSEISDQDSLSLSKKIASEIEQKLEKFPGDIVVNVIRESRSKAVAKSI